MAQVDLADAPAKAKVHVAQPEPDLTPEIMIARATALRPMLRAQQDEADARGHYGEDVHEAFDKAGFYRTLQPKMFGGYQFDFPTFLKVIMEISRGHPGSGWCFTLAASHALVVGSHFPEAVQRELFGPKGDFRAPHRAAPGGTLRRVDGGYQITGRWSYSSGVPVGTHFIGGCFIEAADGQAKGANLITPRANIEIVEDWGDGASLGMEGSGSNTVKLTDVFVPERHVFTDDILISSEAFGLAGPPGASLHGDPMYLGVVGGCYQSTFGAIFVGAARAALDEYEETARTNAAFRKPGMMRSDDYESQLPFGRALSLTDSAEAVTLSVGQQFMEQCQAWAREGRPITARDTMKLWAMSRQAALMACEAIETLFHASPVKAANRGQKLQRYFRDAQMYRIHPSAQPWVDLGRARAEFGVPIERFGR